MARTDTEKNISTNRQARREFELLQRFEAGLVLRGTEVKSLRAGTTSLKEAFIRVDDAGEAWLMNCHITPWTHAGRDNHDPVRPRKLLLHASELVKLRRGTQEKGMTIVPLRLYFKGSRVKVEIALAKGKKLHDKRHDLKARDARREMQRRE